MTIKELEAKIKKGNEDTGSDFSIERKYDNWELWANGEERLEAGSVKDVYNAWVKYRFQEKYTKAKTSFKVSVLAIDPDIRSRNQTYRQKLTQLAQQFGGEWIFSTEEGHSSWARKNEIVFEFKTEEDADRFRKQARQKFGGIRLKEDFSFIGGDLLTEDDLDDTWSYLKSDISQFNKQNGTDFKVKKDGNIYVLMHGNESIKRGGIYSKTTFRELRDAFDKNKNNYIGKESGGIMNRIKKAFGAEGNQTKKLALEKRLLDDISDLKKEMRKISRGILKESIIPYTPESLREDYEPEEKNDRKDSLMPNGIPRYIRCYDNGGETADRYTVVYTGRYTHKTGGSFWYVGMSENPFHPQGFGQHGESQHKPIDADGGSHLGRRIKFFELPPKCQELVIDDYKNLWDIE